MTAEWWEGMRGSFPLDRLFVVTRARAREKYKRGQVGDLEEVEYQGANCTALRFFGFAI